VETSRGLVCKAHGRATDGTTVPVGRFLGASAALVELNSLGLSRLSGGAAVADFSWRIVCLALDISMRGGELQ